MAVAIAFTASNSNTSSLTSYTYTAQSIGTASSDRVVLVGVFSRVSATYTQPTVTIGGVSATLLLASEAFANPGGVSIYGLNVTSGTTADIVVGYSTSANRNAIAIWAMTGTSGATGTSATAVASSGSPTISTTINVPANGGGVAVSADFSGGSLTSTWAGYTTKDVDIQPGTNAFSAAHSVFVGAQTGLTVSDTFSGTTASPRLAVVSFGPAVPVNVTGVQGAGAAGAAGPSVGASALSAFGTGAAGTLSGSDLSTAFGVSATGFAGALGPGVLLIGVTGTGSANDVFPIPPAPTTRAPLLIPASGGLPASLWLGSTNGN